MASTYARLAALWFGVQFVWGAILAVSLQARSTALAPHDGLAAYSLIASLGALVGMVTQLVSGPLADRAFARRGNRRTFYAAGVGIAVPALLWFYLAPNYPQLVAAFFLLQFGMNVLGGPYAAIVPDYVAPQRAGAASSWMGILQAVGNVCGLLVAGFVESRGVVALLLVGGLVASWIVTARATSRAAPAAAGREPFAVSRAFRTLLGSRMAINFGFYTLLGFLFFFVAGSLNVRAGAVRTTTALLFLTFTLGNVLGALAGAKPVDRFDKRAVVFAANGVVGIGLLGLMLTRSVVWAFMFAAIAGIAWGTYFIADWALACTVLPRNAMAFSMGVWNIAATLPQIVAPLVTAPIVERVNASAPGVGPRAAIGLAIIEFTLGALWLYRLPAPDLSGSTGQPAAG
jgi:MFS family permease